ncbi:MAG: permease [Phycisphaeraceae bacterium]|nr:permease [Phycisphaeraceae bacterium]
MSESLMQWLGAWGESALTAAGFFWKAGWAFVLGYGVSAMIQAFVPKGRLTPWMGKANVPSVAVGTLFGAISSSCSFAALATARALLTRGAHFVVAVAFMFASTNLVIELGVLIWIFLGPGYVLAEIVGGLVLIAISATLVGLTMPQDWLEAARAHAESTTEDEPEDFDWRERLRTLSGWSRVGDHFVMEWGMVWREITVGFTVAGFVATLVPESFWQFLFLSTGEAGRDAPFWVVLENAAVAPWVAAATFIGSMGNIPLATVLAAGGVTFGGIMAFIYADLMVPPLVKVNARYYGWRVAIYLAGVMYVSMVTTALLLHYGLLMMEIDVSSTRRMDEVTRFKLDYTFWMNVVAVGVVGLMLWLRSRGGEESGDDHEHDQEHDHEEDHDGGGVELQDIVTWLALALVGGGLIATAIV